MALSLILVIPEYSSNEGNHKQDSLNYFASFHFSDPVPFVEFERIKWMFDMTELKICVQKGRTLKHSGPESDLKGSHKNSHSYSFTHPCRAFQYLTEPQVSKIISPRNKTVKNTYRIGRMASKVPLLLTSWACFLSLTGFFKLTYPKSFMLYIKCSDYEISVLLIIKNDATDVARGSPHFKLFSQKEESAPLVSPLREPWFGDWINRSLDSLGDLLSTLDSKMLLNFS